MKQYHLLITRNADGFQWQIRYGRNAKPATVSDRTYWSQQDAQIAGQRALALVAAACDPGGAQEK